MGIKENTLINKIFEISEFWFKLCFLLFGLMTFNSFFAHTKSISVVLMLTTIFAGIALVYRLINFKHFIRNKMLWLAAAFTVSYIASLLLNMRYFTFNAVKTLVFMGMEYCLLLATDDRKSFEDYKSEVRLFLRIMWFYMFVSAVASIVLMLCGYSNIVERNGQIVMSGFVWGRLWGTFTDPNYGSVLAAMTIIIALYEYKGIRNRLWRVLCVINIVAQALYISFSDSRTGAVTAFAAVGLYCYGNFVKMKLNMKSAAKYCVCVLLSLVVGLCCLGAFKAINKGYNSVVMLIVENDSKDNPEELQDKYIIGREEDIEHDFSNRRIDLWISGLETFRLKPVFGVSFNSLVDFVKENLPDTYLLTNDNGIFNNYHNTLVNVLVGQGAVGLAILLVMIVYAGLKLIKRVTDSFNKEDYSLRLTLFVLLVAALLSAMFVSELVYTVSVNMMLFWYLLGVMLKKSGEDSGNDKNQRDNSCI